MSRPPNAAKAFSLRRRMKSEQKIKFSRRKTIVFSVIICAVLIAILETSSYFLISRYAETGTFENREIQNPFHPFLGWSHTPNAHLKTYRDYSTGENYIDTDGDGNSITPLSVPNPELRVFVTGGSSMFGVGSSSNETTVASLLERKIHDRLGVAMEVTNLGVRAYQSFQEMLRLHEYLLDHDVDIVLAVSGRNDAGVARRQRNIRHALLSEHVYINAVPLVRAAELQKPIFLNVDGFFRQYSYFIDLVARAVRRITASAFQPVFSSYRREQIDMAESGELFSNISERASITLSHYRLMDTISRNKQARFYFVVQPTAFSWAHYPSTISPILEDPELSLIEKKYEVLFYEALIDLAGDLPIYDFRRTMDVIENPMPYEDKAHYTDAGADVLSDALYELIEPEILHRMEGRNGGLSGK